MQIKNLGYFLMIYTLWLTSSIEGYGGTDILDASLQATRTRLTEQLQQLRDIHERQQENGYTKALEIIALAGSISEYAEMRDNLSFLASKIEDGAVPVYKTIKFVLELEILFKIPKIPSKKPVLDIKNVRDNFEKRTSMILVELDKLINKESATIKLMKQELKANLKQVKVVEKYIRFTEEALKKNDRASSSQKWLLIREFERALKENLKITQFENRIPVEGAKSVKELSQRFDSSR